MKRTTYILMGMFAAGLVTLVAIFIITFYLGKRPIQTLTFAGTMITKEVGAFRIMDVLTIKLHEENSIDYCFDDRSELEILPSPDGKNRISYPEDFEKFLSVEIVGDTLRLCIEMSEEALSEDLKDMGLIILSGINLSLTVDSTFDALRSELGGKVRVKEIKQDSLMLSAASLDVESCRLRALSVCQSNLLNIVGSQITDLHLDLDNGLQYTVEHSDIDTEYLIGNEFSQHKLSQRECRRIIWIPKDKDAEMKLSFKDSTTLIFPE